MSKKNLYARKIIMTNIINKGVYSVCRIIIETKNLFLLRNLRPFVEDNLKVKDRISLSGFIETLENMRTDIKVTDIPFYYLNFDINIPIIAYEVLVEYFTPFT